MSEKVSHRGLVVAAIMASMAMIAIEATIVSTAMPQIAAQLGQLNLYSWVFSAFLLSQTALTVVFGKLSDIYGRKPIVLAGIAVFLVASILCGFAWSMPSMIAFRLLQGIGAGAIQPVAMTVVADLFPGSQRGKVQGYLASVWALSAVVGPLLGSVIIHNLPWAWIFWINVPVGLAAAAAFILFYHEEKHTRTVSIDILGAVLFAVSISALMIGLTVSETGLSTSAIVSFVLFAVSLALFIWQERRVEEPMVAPDLWLYRPIAAANISVFFASMAIMGLTTFLPMYVQTVLNQSPLVAGFALTMLLLGWPCGATIASRNFTRFGLRPIMLVGAVFVPVGTFLLTLLTPSSSAVLAGAGSLVMGFGMGLLNIGALILTQGSVAASQRGSATASNVFSRNLGSTLGAAILGAVLSWGLVHTTSGQAITTDQLRALLNGTGLVSGDAEAVRLALQDGLHATFLTMLLFAVLIVPACLFVPRDAVHKDEPAPA
ncbi:MFS transporter [Rhizobium sp. Leaf306]|uniref:EmrB/QacA subfamily drug resistance transporter n=1 Tax=Rhizobium soli TaxID=424798 RepID=A0A7X0MRY8_9HYPH|nr:MULTISPECIES: MDR family MFS transporter [Rhizobium]RYE69810.1 MAG: MFS transporter [Rhizobiaceae bacterium]KQQ38137.1 MFS transporter [Rhizobium sp. Leaf306]KQQ73759.1 MFS transporter [Rhizobium sp. Leaf321]MBB6507665.1 EmrB/QacA subfamily drug resistance transporter [Rhizobium soli]MBD8652747.1 MFS transporter [Rhizobium sp. CFBP 13726]